MRTAPRPPLTKRLGAAHWLALDCVVAVGYAAVLAAVTVRGHAGWPVPLELAAIAVLALATALRRLRPLVALVAVLVVMVALRWPYQSLVPAWSALYLVAVDRRRRVSLTALAAVLVAPLVAAPTLDRAVLIGLMSGLVWAVGYASGRHRAYERQSLEQHARQAEADLERARRGVTEERMRIARELHDVVAHSMSVITVQAGFGRLVSDHDPAQARAALEVIENTGREALTEMRRLLGVLRADDGADASARTPAPDLSTLDRLVAQTASAGVRVDVEITGRPRRLPPGIELSAYRIVQEALTNVVKHAGTPASRVTLGYREDELAIEVSDDGPRSRIVDGQGHGLIGMRERVNLYGGSLHAGPLPGRGFHVVARLPLGPAS